MFMGVEIIELSIRLIDGLQLTQGRRFRWIKITQLHDNPFFIPFFQHHQSIHNGLV